MRRRHVMKDPRPVAVVYDFGAAGPAEIAAAAGRCSLELTFIVDRSSDHVRMVMPTLHRWGGVCDITDLTAAAAVRAVAALGPCGVLTFSEARLEITAILADGCGIPYWHSVETTRLLTDKLEQRRALRDGGVGVISFADVRSTAEVPAAVSSVGLPAVMKPRRGSGARYTYPIQGLSQGIRAAEEYFSAEPDGGPMLLESLLAGDQGVAGRPWGDYVSVESLVDSGSAHAICVTGKFPLAPPFREQGYFLPATISAGACAQAIAMADLAIKALGIRHGVIHSELKLTPDGPQPLEVNGRVGGHIADLLRRSCGYNIVESALRLATGLPVQHIEPDIKCVTYQYILHSPVVATKITSIEGTDELAALDGVDVVEVRMTAGQQLDWRYGALGMLGKVYGKVGSHEELLDVAQKIETTFRPSYCYSHAAGPIASPGKAEKR